MLLDSSKNYFMSGIGQKYKKGLIIEHICFLTLYRLMVDRPQMDTANIQFPVPILRCPCQIFKSNLKGVIGQGMIPIQPRRAILVRKTPYKLTTCWRRPVQGHFSHIKILLLTAFTERLSLFAAQFFIVWHAKFHCLSLLECVLHKVPFVSLPNSDRYRGRFTPLFIDYCCLNWE